MSDPKQQSQPQQHLVTAVVFRDAVRIGVSDIKTWRANHERPDAYTARLTQFGVRFDPADPARFKSITVPMGNVLLVEHGAA